jgi:hypothetical protein
MLMAESECTLKLTKTLWGVNCSSRNWDSIFSRIKHDGFSAVETIPLCYQHDSKNFKASLSKYGVDMEIFVSTCNNMCVGLDLVVQIHTAGGYIDQQTHEYIYCNSCNVRW